MRLAQGLDVRLNTTITGIEVSGPSHSSIRSRPPEVVAGRGSPARSLNRLLHAQDRCDGSGIRAVCFESNEVLVADALSLIHI